MLPVLYVCAIALCDNAGRVLLARRPEGKDMAGLWEFPGGKIHEGETPETALVREMEEELSILVDERHLLPLSFASHAYRSFHLFMPLFACRQWNGDVCPTEGQKIAWAHAEELKDYAMPPADINLKEIVARFLKECQ